MEEKVLQYEKFLNEILRRDLQKVLEERDKIYSEIAEYLQLKNVIQKLKEEDPGRKGLKSQVDLGCNFYVQAKVPDASKIFVAIGFGFFLEMNFDEALKFIEKKELHLNGISDKLSADALKVKMHIKVVLEGLRELQRIDAEPDKEPFRDIFA
ncbi:hypothetical protein CAPTEDRAFT_1365 [Capitella teleta]|uniref:Protein UXT n=1 Tax=Capitella teleta TaxID=283909 RepID=R7VLH0_CAPTE|nr:hypothetical protein CAPTEDRAFT_1365 [Capitella teleta]|eukprot:ELU18251.1 hypothetical protein CAPTEDRAFT_1365 [Capitella teleta]